MYRVKGAGPDVEGLGPELRAEQAQGSATAGSSPGEQSYPGGI